MPSYRDKNNNFHPTKKSLNEANTKIDAEHVLRSFFMQDDATRVVTLEQINQQHVNALAVYVKMKDKVTTEAVEEKKTGF